MYTGHTHKKTVTDAYRTHNMAVTDIERDKNSGH